MRPHSSILFFFLLLAGGFPARGVYAQSSPFFDTFSYSWHDKPGVVKPKATPVLGATSPNGAWDKVIWARGSGWPTVDYLAENVDTDLSGGQSKVILSVTPPSGPGKAAGGAEIIHKVPRIFGSFRASLKASPSTWKGMNSPGVCNGFYVISPQVEIDMEFLSVMQGWKDPSLNKNSTWQFEIVIHDYTFHPGNRLSFHQVVPLPWDPSKAFHVYGFDWYPGRVEFVVDGVVVAVVKNGAQGRINVPPWKGGLTFPSASNAKPATLRLCNWTDLLGWCGQAPSKRTDFLADWVVFSPLYFRSSVSEVSSRTGGSALLDLQGGAVRRGTPYLVLASLKDLDKGFPLGTFTLPLEFDLSMSPLLLSLANTPTFGGFLGILDSAGSARPVFRVPPGSAAYFAGIRFHFCPLLFQANGSALGPPGGPVTVTLK